MPTDLQEEFEQDNQMDDPNGDADFAAAFNATRAQAGAEGPTANGAAPAGGAPVEEPKPEEPDPEAEAAAARAAAEAEAAAAAERAAAEANSPVTLTKQQMDSIQATLALVPQLQQQLQQKWDSTAGRIGSIQQTVDALKSQAGKGQAPTIKQLKRLQAELPELAALLMEDLTDAFAPADGAAPDPAPAGQPTERQAQQPAVPTNVLEDPRVVQVLRDKEMTILDARHPDWRDLRATPEFAEWRHTLPEVAQQMLATSWDSSVMTDAFNDFKAWRAQRSADAEAQADANKQRDKRLEAATPATTGAASGVNVVDEDAAFLSGFNGVRGRG